MTLAMLQAIRETVGDLTIGQIDADGICFAPCANCFTATDVEFMEDVSEFLPLIRGKVCGDCEHEIQSESHVDGHCRCGACARRVAQADAWGLRVVR